MSTIVLMDVPVAEWPALKKQLKKYLPYGSRIRARGKHHDRVKLAKATGRAHKHLREDVPIHLAEQLRVYITQESLPRWLKRVHSREWWFSVDEAMRVRWFGPFKTLDAAIAARQVTKGIDR